MWFFQHSTMKVTTIAQHYLAVTQAATHVAQQAYKKTMVIHLL